MKVVFSLTVLVFLITIGCSKNNTSQKYVVPSKNEIIAPYDTTAIDSFAVPKKKIVEESIQINDSLKEIQKKDSLKKTNPR